MDCSLACCSPWGHKELDTTEQQNNRLACLNLFFTNHPKSESESCSVLSDSLWPHGLRPARLLCPWNSPGKNTGVGCPSLLQGIFPTQRSNPGLTHSRQILYYLSHLRQSIEPSRWGCSNRFLVIPPVSHLAQPSCMHTQIPRKEGDFIMTACSGFRWGWRQTQTGGAPADGHPAGAGPASLLPWGPLSLWHPGHTAFIPRVALTPGLSCSTSQKSFDWPWCCGLEQVKWAANQRASPRQPPDQCQVALWALTPDFSLAFWKRWRQTACPGSWILTLG